MIILKPSIYGLCQGSKKALEIAYQNKFNNAVVYKEILHNEEIIKDLRANGIDTVKEIIDNKKIIIRAHGEPKVTFDYLEKNNIYYIDATCPNVKRVQKIIEEHYNQGYKIIIIGKNNHPEVNGENGWCNDEAIIINSLDFDFEIKEKTLVVCQTTFNYELAEKIIGKLKNEHTKVINTICNAQKRIQDSSIELAKKVDLMIVVGGKNSSNTKELYNMCKKHTEAIMISNYEEAKLLKLDKTKIIGITGGASTPLIQIDNIIKILE